MEKIKNKLALLFDHYHNKLGIYKFCIDDLHESERGEYPFVIMESEIVKEAKPRSGLDLKYFIMNHGEVYFNPNDGDMIYDLEDLDEVLLRFELL